MKLNYKDYLNNKKVLIAGPAPNTLTYSNEYLESFDVVVRINTKQVMEFKSDVVYVNIICEREFGNDLAESKEIKYIVGKNANSRFNRLNINNWPDHPVFKEYRMGILTILDILSYNIKSLHVIGFSFYQGQPKDYYMSKYIDTKTHNVESTFNDIQNNKGIHDNNKDMEAVKHLLKNNSNFTISNEMQKILGVKNDKK